MREINLKERCGNKTRSRIKITNAADIPKKMCQVPGYWRNSAPLQFTIYGATATVLQVTNNSYQETQAKT